MPEPAGNPDLPQFLIIGRVTKPHGVRGEVRVQVYSDSPERFTWLNSVYVGEDNLREVAVEGVRFHQSWVLLKLKGYDDRDAAEALRSEWLQVPIAQAIPLAENEAYVFQVIGLAVISTEGEELGTVTEVLETAANDVFIVRGHGGELLLPNTEEVVRSIDLAGRKMTVQLLPGLR